MIVHCHSDMTETSSSECSWRCIARCFGFERMRLESNTKTILEPTQNGFTHLEDERKNGHATVVRVCQPSSSGRSNHLKKRKVGEKTSCCVLQQACDDEIPYEYEPVPTKKDLDGCCSIAKHDLSNGLSDNIDTKSDKAIVNGNGHIHVTQNGAIDRKLQLSNVDQVEEKDSNDHLTELSVSSQRLPSKVKTPDIGISKDYAVLGSNSGNNNFQDMRDLFPSLSEESCDFSRVMLDDVAIDSSAVPEGDFKVTEHELVLSNGNVSSAEIISNLQGEEKKEEPLQNDQDEGHDIFYFKCLIEKETIRLNNLIQEWEKVLSDQPGIHEEVRDEIRSVNGQTHLVVSERFTQFKSLIEQSERQGNGEQNDTKVVTHSDLQGFWDMIYFQVQDVISKFERLDKIRSSDWNHQILHNNDKKLVLKKNARKSANIRKKRTAKTTTSQTSTTSVEEKARRMAARRRLAEARKRIAAQEQTQAGNFIVQ